MKPLEIKDFSGGLTDNTFQGEPTRAERLENLLVGIDHRLSSRMGTKVTNNLKKDARINSIHSFNSFNDLVYSSEGNFYSDDGSPIVGPIGNAAFVGALDDSVYTSSELNGHLILANDDTLQPQKIYIDENNVPQVRTVGLPKVTRTAISDADLLAECITAANLLRTNFLAHINSAENLDSERDGVSANYTLASEQPVTSTNAHWSVDKYAKSYLESVTFSIGQWQPNTIPTPAPLATDYDSLVALLEALNFGFEEHRQDSAGFAAITDSASKSLIFGPNRYHALGYQTQFTDFVTNFGFSTSSGLINEKAKPLNQGIQQRVSKNYNPNAAINASIPENKVYRTKLIAIANFLDDFAVKFCLHETAPFVHRYNSQNSPSNSLVEAAFSHQFLAPIITDSPVVIPTPFNFIYASNFVQRAFKNHALNTDNPSALDATYPTMHTASNESIVSGLPAAGFYFATLPATPTIRQQYSAFIWDTILAKIAIFTARYSYFVHSIDLLQGQQSNTSDLVDLVDVGGVPGAYTLKLVSNVPLGVPYTLGNKGEVLMTKYGPSIPSTYTAKVSSKAPRQESFNGITNNIGSGWYNVCFSALGIGVPAKPNPYCSVGTFVMHPYPVITGNSSFPSFSTTSQYLTGFGYAPDIYSLSGWVDLIKSFYDAFKVHLSTVNTHYNIATAAFEFWNSDVSSGLPAGGVEYFPLSSLLPSVDLPNTQPQFILPEIKSYGYAFTYSDTYKTKGDLTFLVESAPIFIDAVNSEETLAVGVTKEMYGETTYFLTNEIITPVAMILGAEDLVNTSDTNYANVLLNTYRTRGNGSEYFKINTLAATPLSSLVWPTITLLGNYDLVSDAYSINGNIALDNSLNILYTNGGVSPSNQPPKCNYTWLANGYVYYAGVYDGDTFLPNRVVQSNQLAPDWVPSQNYVDFESPVVGGGSARNVNICLTENGVYRLEGAFGTDGSGSIVKQQISNQVGGISAGSVVVTEIGVFFAGSNGFYYTDGYQCIRISQELFKTYPQATKIITQKRGIKGSYDRTNRRVYWAMQSSFELDDNDMILVFDLNFGITPSGTFTRLRGGEGSWNPSSLHFQGSLLFIGDKDGYLYYSDENVKTDPLKNLATAPNTWFDTVTIPWEYRSTMMDFGGTAMRKFFSRIHHVGKNLGDVAIQYYITADNRVTQNLAPMRFIDNGGTGIVDQWRRVGGKKLRADLYQVGVKNGRFTVYNSDTYGTTPIFVSNVAGQTTIRMSGSLLPSDTKGMSICFESDYYTKEFTILETSINAGNTMLVLDDALNEANSLLALGWEIRGYMKEQAFSLDALTIWFEEQGNLGSQYRGYASEEGGGGNK